jgi:hypothetical protein
MDLKGYFPMRLLNMLIGTIIPKSFDLQKKILEKIAKNGGKEGNRD